MAYNVFLNWSCYEPITFALGMDPLEKPSPSHGIYDSQQNSQNPGTELQFKCTILFFCFTKIYLPHI